MRPAVLLVPTHSDVILLPPRLRALGCGARRVLILRPDVCAFSRALWNRSPVFAARHGSLWDTHTMVGILRFNLSYRGQSPDENIAQRCIRTHRESPERYRNHRRADTGHRGFSCSYQLALTVSENAIKPKPVKPPCRPTAASLAGQNR